MYLLDLFVRYLAKVRSLWEVLPHQAVGVLVQSAFPGMTRSGEEELCLEGIRHTTVVCELLAVICGDCVDRDLVGIQQSDRGRAHRLFRFFLSTRPSNVYFVARSANDTTAPLCPLPTMVSASQSPSRSFASTMAGRSEMPTRPEIWPRQAWLLPFWFGFLPRRRSFVNKSPPVLRSA